MKTIGFLLPETDDRAPLSGCVTVRYVQILGRNQQNCYFPLVNEEGNIITTEKQKIYNFTQLVMWILSVKCYEIEFFFHFSVDITLYTEVCKSFRQTCEKILQRL